MFDLPLDLFVDILSRVPIDSLLRSRCVCTAWRRFLDDPQFIKLHLHHQYEAPKLIIAKHKLFTLSLESQTYFKNPSQNIETRPLNMLIPYEIPFGYFLSLISCDGLILITHLYKENAHKLWNPFTRESHVLPSFSNITKSQGESFRTVGFGYDRLTDDYKVVQIGYVDNPETLVYSLKLNSWRKVVDCPCYYPWRCNGVFLNGSLHWPGVWKGGEGEFRQLVLVFDLGTENYRLLPLPPSMCPSPCLDALGGSLFVSDHSSVYRLDDYGGANTWTMVLRFGRKRDIRLVHYLKSEQKVLFRKRGEYFWADIGDKNNFDSGKYFSVKNFDTRGRNIANDDDADIAGYGPSQVCPASLVRLNTSSGVSASTSVK